MDTEKFVVEGRDYTRTVWFAAGPKETSHPLCVLLDGEFYKEKADALPILEKLVADGRIPPMSFVVVSYNDPNARHEDFTCNEKFARYIAEDVVSWAKNQLSTINSEGNLICGLSLSGLASAHIALLYPHVFTSSLCQSGSFWWDRMQFSSLVSEQSSPIKPRFWISVGDKEVDENVSHPPTGMFQEFTQVVGAQSAVDALKEKGAVVRHHVFSGGHEFGPWMAELGDALEWLVGNTESSSRKNLSPENSVYC